MYKIREVKSLISIKGFITAFEVIYNDDFFFNGENHNFWEFVYVIDGKIGVTADDKVHELSKGEIIFHKPMEFHKLWALPGIKPHLFIMSFTAEGPLMKKFENSVFHLNSQSVLKIKDLIENVRQHKKENTDKYSLENWDRMPIVKQIIASYMEIFLLSIINNQRIPETILNSKSAIAYRQIINFMKDNLDKDLSVQDIAKMCNLSVGNLKKIFAKYSVYGVRKHFLKLKMLKAVELLEEEYSILEISEMLSFNNQNYFSAVFKREMGYAPLVYKKKILGK